MECKLRGCAMMGWLGRIVRLLMVVAAAVLVVHTIADRLLIHRFLQNFEAIKTSGRPRTVSDLDLPPLTYFDNAYVYYERAYQLIRKDVDESTNNKGALPPDHPSALICRFIEGPTDNWPERPVLADEELAAFEAYLARLQPAFDLLRESLSCEMCAVPDWLYELAVVNASSGVHAVRLPGLAMMREATRYAAAKGLWEFERGNFGEAYDWFVVGLDIANNHRGYPTVIAALNGFQCMRTTLQAMERALYDRPLSMSPPESFFVELRSFMDADRFAAIFDHIRVLHQHRTWPYLVSWSFKRPLLVLNLLQSTDSLLTLGDIVRTNDFAAAEARLAPIRQWCVRPPFYHAAAAKEVSGWLKMVEAIRQTTARAALCETALQLKDHKRLHGAYPEALAALESKMVNDPYTNEAFQYERMEDGFRLVSAGNVVESEHGLQTSNNLVWRCRQ